MGRGVRGRGGIASLQVEPSEAGWFITPSCSFLYFYTQYISFKKLLILNEFKSLLGQRTFVRLLCSLWIISVGYDTLQSATKDDCDATVALLVFYMVTTW